MNTEFVKCPHCNNLENATFDFCSKCDKGLSDSWKPDAAYVRMRSQKRDAKRRRTGLYVVFALVVLAVIGVFSSLQISGQKYVDDFNASASAQSAADDLRFSGHCSGIQYAVDETTSILAGTATLDEILKVLLKNGNLFQGYSRLVADPDQAGVIQDAGEEMLQLRVELTSGEDTTKTAMWLKSNFLTISSVCRD
jgi:hypothetical protein